MKQNPFYPIMDALQFVRERVFRETYADNINDDLLIVITTEFKVELLQHDQAMEWMSPAWPRLQKTIMGVRFLVDDEQDEPFRIYHRRRWLAK